MQDEQMNVRPIGRPQMCSAGRQRMQATPAPCALHGIAGALSLRIERLGHAARGFRRDQRGAVALESAFGITVLVISLAVLMEIVNTVYASDRMERAARAAARAVALDPAANDPHAVACAAILSELDLDPAFDCVTAPAWTLTVDNGVSPSALPATIHADAQTGTGDLILVRIGWSDDENQGSRVAMALARCE